MKGKLSKCNIISGLSNISLMESYFRGVEWCRKTESFPTVMCDPHHLPEGYRRGFSVTFNQKFNRLSLASCEWYSRGQCD